MYIDNPVISGVPDGTARTCSDSDRRGCDPAANDDSVRIQHTHGRPVGFAITLSFTNTNSLTHSDNDIDTGRTIDTNRNTCFDYA